MSKTITITNEVYGELVKRKKANESFSKLFTRLMTGNNGIDVLTKLRGSWEFKGDEKRKVLAEIKARRAERRYNDSGRH